VRLRVLAVGKLRESYWRDACAEYVKRLGRYATVEVFEVADRDLSRGIERVLAEEGADLTRALTAGSHVVALDVAGPRASSEEFARHLGDLLVGGVADITFVVGGSAGLAPDVLTRADERLSLSAMTLPHQLCRVVLLEQVYRAFRIMRGEPYHL
jgi:23S rRNA (pseudouridine1915-N3)-methyltransferase